MKLFALSLVLASLGFLPGAAGAQVDPMRAIEVAEVHRMLDASIVADLDAEPRLAARAALAIGRIEDPAGMAPLRAHLDSRVPGVRAMCAYGLGLLKDRASASALMALARNDRNSAVRYAAIDAVGRILTAYPNRETLVLARDALTVALGDADPIVRAHGAAQLEVFHGSPFAPEIAHMLERAQVQEHDETVRWHNAWTIFRGYSGLVSAAFLRAELHDRNELVRVEAARAWGRRSDPGAAAVVRTALNDPSWRVQLEAIEALRRIEHLAPTDHLLADPKGLHLPPIPKVAAAPAVSPVPLASESGEPKLAAPDPTRFELARPVLATSARDLARLGAAEHPRVRITTTEGDVVLRLAPEWAPATVANFLTLVDRGYYNGNRWFRIVPDFVDQTGDPTDNGEGDAGYAITAEENPLEERSGVIAMGLNYNGSGAVRDSAGTQFYITLSPQLHLDRDFSVFGEVERGSNVLAHLVERDRIVKVVRIADD